MTSTCPRQSSVSRRRLLCRRKGAIILLSVFLMVPLLGFLALSIDTGMIMLTRTQLQTGADAGALAGAGVLANGDLDEVTAAVQEYVLRNAVNGKDISPEDIQVELGAWDLDTRTFTAATEDLTAVRVVAQAEERPVFFSRIFGFGGFDARAEAVATFRPRDIVLVLDCSGSMNDDSEFQQIDTLGRAAIIANQFQIYQELGSPVFGNMQWEPVYISSNSTRSVLRRLGLDRVPYPYPKGSWNGYVNYVMNDRTVSRAGYRKKYGYLTLIQYWLVEQEAYDATPDLWRTSEQPITAVKNAVSIFLGYINEVKSDDRVGLSIYTYSNSGALLATPLTRDLALVEQLSRQHQAGHYMPYTNIGAGLREARQELEENARLNALKMVVLLTDGLANRPSGDAYGLVRREAERCAENGFPVITISLGANADTGLMQEVADTTGGIHFNVPGGRAVSEYEEDLKEIFRKIAAHRELTLVK
jgi:Mg-chelatase subunit ChlD